jgi:pimeloyl-ACP methyl ester carboxylesterase
MEIRLVERTSRLLGLAFGLLFQTLPAWGGPVVPDYARERRWADEIVDTVMVGEPVWLEADQRKFLSLYASPPAGAAPARHGAILIHGRGVHPAWGFIENLRADLTEFGWPTLSLQMPVLAADVKLKNYGETFPEAFRRIDSGIAFLKDRGIGSVVLIGHSTGAITAAAYVTERPRAPVAGVVAVGFTTIADGNRYMQAVRSVERLKCPVLDIYGSEDVPEVLNHAGARAAAARKAGNPDYTQVQVPGGNHFHTDSYDQLKTQLVRWLNKLK